MLKKIVDSKFFQNTILVFIILTAVLVGLETSSSLVEKYGPVFHTLDKIVLWIFALEAIIKIASFKSRWFDYFKDPWNMFDFTIVAFCFLPIGGQYAAVLRLVRILRALRLISIVPKLQLLVGSLIKSLPSLIYVGLLLTILFYIYAVLGVFSFRANDPVHFKDLPTALLTLFRVVTLEDWTDVMYIQMHGSAAYPGYSDFAFSEMRQQSIAQPFIGALYFVSFVLLGTMVMLNLFIGVIISSMEETHAEQEAEDRKRHIQRDGHISLNDELIDIQNQLRVITRRLSQLQK